MAEILFANLSKTGMKLSTITGASGTLTNLEIVGTHSGGQITDTREVNVNGSSVLTGNHSTARGMTLVIFNRDMTVDYIATFDLHASDNAIMALNTKLSGITSTQIAVMCSRDAINSNNPLDATMKRLRSNAWPGTKWFNPGAGVVLDRRRTSYAAIVCGRKRVIVSEKMVGHGAKEGKAAIQMAFSDPTRIGYSGFGKPIIDDTGIEFMQSTGTNELIHIWLNQSLSSLSLSSGMEYMFNSLAEIDAIAANGDTYVQYEISFFKGDTLSSQEIRTVSSVEGWQQVEIRGSIPSDVDRIMVSAKQKRNTPGTVSGTVYVKNTVMTLSDNTQSRTAGVSIGVNGTSVKRYEDSLGNFGHYDPDGYYAAYKDDSNLLRDLPIQQHVNEPIRWMNKVIDNPNERVVIKTNANLERDSSVVNIDPNKMYYCSVWVNKQVKTKGSFMLGFRSLNSAGEMQNLRRTDSVDGSSGVNPYLYSQTPEHDYLEDRQWYLLQGFLLPHNITQDDATKFVEENNEFYGWDDLYGNGIGVSSEGTGYYGWVNSPNCVQGKLAFLDWYNNESNSTSLWALPIIREVKLGSIDIDDAFISSISLS